MSSLAAGGRGCDQRPVALELAGASRPARGAVGPDACSPGSDLDSGRALATHRRAARGRPARSDAQVSLRLDDHQASSCGTRSGKIRALPASVGKLSHSHRGQHRLTRLPPHRILFAHAFPGGVIGSTTGFGPVSSGSSPARETTLQADACALDGAASACGRLLAPPMDGVRFSCSAMSADR